MDESSLTEYIRDKIAEETDFNLIPTHGEPETIEGLDAPIESNYSYPNTWIEFKVYTQDLSIIRALETYTILNNYDYRRTNTAFEFRVNFIPQHHV